VVIPIADEKIGIQRCWDTIGHNFGEVAEDGDATKEEEDGQQW